MALGLTNYLKNSHSDYMPQSQVAWNTFSKTSDQRIVHYKSTIQELEDANILKNTDIETKNEKETQKDKVTTRVPSSAYHNNRLLIGEISSQLLSNVEKLPMLNTINPHWKENLGMELVRFHSSDTKVLIKKEESLIRIQNGKGLFTERVVVSYLNGDNPISSFKALIDSDSGKIIETWDNTIQEKITSPEERREFLRIPSSVSSSESGIKATID